MRKFFISFILFFTSTYAQNIPIKEILSDLPVSDRQALNQIFAWIVQRDHLSYTLFGDKPITLSGHFIKIPSGKGELMNSLPFVQENIPVNMNFITRFKEQVHHFFRRPRVVQILTYLPAFLIGKHKALAELIMKCRKIFEQTPQYVDKMQVKIYGGDKLATLVALEKKIESKSSQQFSTIFKFSANNCLDEAREIRKNLTDHNQRIGILNLANRWQPCGVGLAPYGGSQEEYLARRSCLAWAFDPQFQSATVHDEMRGVRRSESYDDEHFEHHIPYFGAVVTTDVTFIDQNTFDEFDIISSAAPDLRAGSDESNYLKRFGSDQEVARQQILENKIKAIFDSAIIENIENLVLGAYGCGCFQNDLEEVAGIFAKVLNLDDYKDRFHHITFAITDDAKLDVFQELIQNAGS